jgi:hypothetical protein
MVVVEDHGNPRGLVMRDWYGEETLRFTISAETKMALANREKPVVTGDIDMGKAVAEFLNLDFNPESRASKVIKVKKSGIAEFIDGGSNIFKLKIHEGTS